MIQLIIFCSSNRATKEPGFLQWDTVLFLLRTCKPWNSHGNAAVIKRRNRFQVASGELQQVLGHRVLFYFLHLRKSKEIHFFKGSTTSCHTVKGKLSTMGWCVEAEILLSFESWLFSFNCTSKSFIIISFVFLSKNMFCFIHL